MNKRAIAILGAIFILIVGTLGFLIYSKYSSKKTDTPVAQNPTTSSTNQPGINNILASTTPAQTNPGGPVQLTSDQVVSPALFFNGNGITYFDHLGNLFQVNIQSSNGQISLSGKKQLAIPVKPNIKKILWPAKGNDFIAQATDSTGKTAWSYFNSSTGAYTDLPPSVQALDWLPSGDRILYVWLSNNKALLETAPPNLQGYSKVGEMFQTDNTLSVSPDGSSALFYETANAGDINTIGSVSIDGKIWKSLIKTGQNFGVLWSPDSQKFLFAKKDPVSLKYQLWVNNLTTGEVKNLGFYTTVEKAVWDKDSNVIYAAVPNSGNPGPSSLTIDSFYRMDTGTLAKKQYSSNPASPVDGRDLFLNATSDTLFFRNAQDGGLYYLDLTQ